MRNFKKGLVTIIATAAVLAPAGLAAADSQSASKSASAPSSLDCLAVVCVFDILNENKVVVSPNVNLNTAINACPNVNVIGLLVGQITKCSNDPQKAYIQRKS